MKDRAQSNRTSRRNPLMSRSNNCDPPTNDNHRDHPSNDLAASSSMPLPEVRYCYLQPTNKILPPPLPLSFSQSISLPLSQSVSSLRKIEFCFVFCFFGLYIGIFYYNICLEAKKMCFLEHFQEHNQTP